MNKRSIAAIMIVCAIMTAFMPAADAGRVTALTITPDTGYINTVSSYNMTMNTTGFSLLNITIPARFAAEAPKYNESGKQIAKIDFWNSSIGWLANTTITANTTKPQNQVDIEAFVNTSFKIYGPIEKLGVPVNYTHGNTTTVNYSVPTVVSVNATLTLPTTDKNGSLNISFYIGPRVATIISKPNNVSISINQSVKNPSKEGNYSFVARADSELTGKQACVQIKPPLKINETMYKNSITQPIDVSKIHYKFKIVDEEWAAKWTNEILYVQKETKYSIAVYLNETGYVTRVDFERWGFPITEIPYGLAEQSLAKLPPGFAVDP